MLKVSAVERNTILAALRLWSCFLRNQRVTADQAANLSDIASDGGEELTAAEVDSLGDRIG